MKYIIPVWIGIFLISYAGVMSPVAFAQTPTVSGWPENAATDIWAVFVAYETYEIKISENVRGISQKRDNNVVAHRISRGRHFLYFCCPASNLLNDYAGKSHEPIIQMEGIDFSLLIENNANAPPLRADTIL